MENINRQKIVNFIVPIIFVLTSLVILYFAIVQTNEYIDAENNYETTIGVLVEYKEYENTDYENPKYSSSQTLYGGIYKYIVDGEEYRTAGAYRTNLIETIAEAININYNPENPAEVNTLNKFTLVILYGLGIVFLVVGTVLLRMEIKKKKLNKIESDLNNSIPIQSEDEIDKDINPIEKNEKVVEIYNKIFETYNKIFETAEKINEVVEEAQENKGYKEVTKITNSIKTKIIVTSIQGLFALTIGIIAIVFVLTSSRGILKYSMEEVEGVIVDFEKVKIEEANPTEYLITYEYEVNNQIYKSSLEEIRQNKPQIGIIETISYDKTKPSEIDVEDDNNPVGFFVFMIIYTVLIIYIYGRLIYRLFRESKRLKGEN